MIGVVMSIGLADSVNPALFFAALYLAAGERPRRKVIEFTLGVFAAYFLGGVVIALGPGQLVLSALPKPGREARAIGEVVVGAVMLATAAVLWVRRGQLAERDLPKLKSEGGSSAVLGVVMTAVELPTAFPYLAAIGAIVDSGLDPGPRLLLLVLFNVCFVLPLILMVAALALFGERAVPLLRGARVELERRWPVAFATLALLAGLIVLALGITGLASPR